MDLLKDQRIEFCIDFQKSQIKNAWKQTFENLGKYSEFCEIVDNWIEVPSLMLTRMKNLLISARPVRLASLEYFVTISFDDSKIEPEKIPKIMAKVIKKKWIKEYLFCIEQRSEEKNVYHGFHVHMYVKSNKQIAPSDVVREVHNSVKNYVGGSNQIDVKKVNSKQGVMNYMEGHKSELKMKKVENDSPMRKKFQFQKIYQSQA